MKNVARKAVIKHQPVSRATSTSLKPLVGRRHFHFCSNRDCRLVYEDACTEPEVNHECRPCRGLRRSIHDVLGRDPQECCIDNCAQVTFRPDFITYQLAGPGPWFQCRTCFRCHGWPCTTT